MTNSTKLQDLTVDKTVTSLSVVNSITNHDLESILSNRYSSSTCYDYVGEEKKKIMAEEISRINPFSKKRPPISLYDKSKGTPFAGMSIEKVDRFLARNCVNFKRRFKRLSTTQLCKQKMKCNVINVLCLREAIQNNQEGNLDGVSNQNCYQPIFRTASLRTCNACQHFLQSYGALKLYSTLKFEKKT